MAREDLNEFTIFFQMIMIFVSFEDENCPSLSLIVLRLHHFV